MPGEFTILGIGADPRIYGYRPISSLAATESAYKYISQHPDEPSVLFDGEVLAFIVEACLELLFSL
jgi:hypothetical protein